MAPEINENKPYFGVTVDLFSSAVVLFIMIAGTFPFSAATKDEYYYKYIFNGKWDFFWKHHYKGKPGAAKFFSEEFKDFIQRLLCYNVEDRMNMEELMNHAWFKGAAPTHEEILKEFVHRKSLT